MSLWEDDGKQMAPDAPPRIEKEQIRAAMKSTFDLFIMSNMGIDTGEVRILGEWGFSYGTYTFDLVAKDGGETSHFSGKFLDIVKRQADGSWKIAIDCHNYNEPSG